MSLPKLKCNVVMTCLHASSGCIDLEKRCRIFRQQRRFILANHIALSLFTKIRSTGDK